VTLAVWRRMSITYLLTLPSAQVLEYNRFQSVTAEHCEDRVSLVHYQPPSSSAAAVTAPGRFRPLSTSFRRSRPWNLHRQRCLDEVSRRENGIGRLLGTASTADYPPVSVEICSSVVGVVSRPVGSVVSMLR